MNKDINKSQQKHLLFSDGALALSNGVVVNLVDRLKIVSVFYY